MKFLRFQFPDPWTRMSLALIERPWPVLLPDTIKSPSSNGSNEMISYSGMPVFRYGLRVLIELATHWVKFGSDLWQTWRNSAVKCNIYNQFKFIDNLHIFLRSSSQLTVNIAKTVNKPRAKLFIVYQMLLNILCVFIFLCKIVKINDKFEFWIKIIILRESH